ncbi:MAG: hypothetical protein QM680_10725 [Luteolibacter sp.]
MNFPARLTLLLAAAAAILAAALLKPAPKPSATAPPEAETDIIQTLLDHHVTERSFYFGQIVEATSGKKVLALEPTNTVHKRVIAAIDAALAATITDLNQPSSPIRKLRRINEGSRFFEDGLHLRLSATPGLNCEIPPNRAGEHQRSGYPDLRITDQASGDVFYLDPKLVESGSETSTLRSFYFEPKTQTLKITDDAVHLVISVLHDGKDGEWTFRKGQLVDLSTLVVHLKAEFQASNADLYKTEN